MAKTYKYPRGCRLLNRDDFQFVLSNTEVKSINDNFVLLAASNNLQKSRLGLIISKKVFPRAVDRNLVKRLMREAFRYSQEQFIGLDIVAISRKGQKWTVTDEIRKKMVTLWYVLKKRCKTLSS